MSTKNFFGGKHEENGFTGNLYWDCRDIGNAFVCGRRQG
jgi:hypothetical protein